MRSEEIRPGDKLLDESGETVYTVLELIPHSKPLVHAHVRYAVDGGSDVRVWDKGVDVPLVHPH